MDSFKDLLLAVAQTDIGQKVIDQAEEFISNALAEPVKSATGLYLTDKINFRRFKNLVKMIADANQLLARAGLTTREIPLKIIHPLLEAASLEEEPELQQVWANLIANAGDPRNLVEVGTMFPGILKDLGSREVNFLDALYSKAVAKTQADPFFDNVSNMIFLREELWDKYASLPMAPKPKENRKEDQRHFWLMFDIIRLHGLLFEAYMEGPKAGQESSAGIVRKYHFSDLGAKFVAACRSPRGKD